MQEVVTLLDAERFVAETAFLKASGIQCSSVHRDDQKQCAKDAARLYVHFGLATGQHHAQQLIRSVESQATKQASQHVEKRPGSSRGGGV
jgi:hypothetical protein